MAKLSLTKIVIGLVLVSAVGFGVLYATGKVKFNMLNENLSYQKITECTTYNNCVVFFKSKGITDSQINDMNLKCDSSGCYLGGILNE